MDPQYEPARSPRARRAWSEVLQPLAADLSANAAALSSAVVGEIRGQFPELFPTDDDFEENRASSEANIAQFAELVAAGREPRKAELPRVAIAYLIEGVRRGVPVGAFVRSLRLGHAAAWKVILAGLEERSADQDQLAAAVELASTWLFAYIEVLSTVAEEIYARERERWLRTAAAVRTETISTREHVAIIGWYEVAEEGRDTIAALEGVIGGLAGRLGEDAPLLEPLGLLAVAAWVGSRSGFDAALLDDPLFDTSRVPGARLALGEPASGLAGFRDSHHEALQARRVATLAGRPPGTVTRYREVALSALATVDLPQARAFVERELVGLVGPDELSERLLATLRIFLEEGASHSRAAKRLGIHENTVRYRINQAEELLGRGVGERTLELRVALSLLGVVEGPREASVDRAKLDYLGASPQPNV